MVLRLPTEGHTYYFDFDQVIIKPVMNHLLSVLCLFFTVGLHSLINAQTEEPNRLAQTLSGKKRSNIQLPVFDLFEVLPPTPLSARNTPFVEKSTLIRLETSQMARLQRQKPDLMQLDVPYNDEVISVELYRQEPTTSAFVVRTPAGIQQVETGLHYRGIIQNDQQSVVSISVFSNEVSGVISSASTHNLVLGKWTNEAGTHMIYREDDLKVSLPFTCSTSDDSFVHDDQHDRSDYQRSAANCTSVYFEASYSLFQDKGSVGNVTNFVSGFFNGVSTIYANEGLNLKMSELYVWDIQDPYNHSSSVSALGSFQNNRPDFNGDLGHLLDYTGSSLGGIANIGVLCSSSNNYAYSDIGNTYSFPAYSWTVNVVAHEIGHNYGSPHTHACQWGPNKTEALDDCYQTEGGCAPGPTPPAEGGTIMSYCHLGADNPGIDFSHGFGSEPGDLLRSKAASASCLGDCSTSGSGGCSIAISEIKEEDATCSENNGKLTVQVSGAVGVVTYDIGLGAQASNVFTGLSPGDYTVTVVNGLGCETQSSASIQMTSEKPGLDATVTNASCGQDDGEVELAGSGGVAPYSFRIGTKTKSDPVFTDLEPGDYNAVLTDDKGCTASKQFTIFTDDVPTLDVDVDDTECGEDNAIVTLSASGGQGPYTYMLDTETSETGQFTDLTAGQYQAAIIDDNDCRVEKQIHIDPSTAIAATAEVIHTDCGFANGTINVSAEGGTGSLRYSIGNGFSSSPAFDSLSAGTYSVTVRDENQCSVTMEKVIEASEGFNVNLRSTPTFCGLENGSVTLEVDGDHGPFKFKKGNGSFGENGVFKDLKAGLIEVTVRDDIGCEASYSTMIEASENPQLRPVVDATHCGKGNGSVDALVENGIEPFTFDLGGKTQANPHFIDLKPGAYMLRVTDAMGCTDSLSLRIDTSEAVSVDLQLRHTTCGQPNGSVAVIPQSGVQPFHLTINGEVQSTDTINDLSAGAYIVRVIDTDNCIYEEEIAVKESPGIALQSKLRHTTCGLSNGMVDIEASGGTGDLLFALDSVFGERKVFDNLASGGYQVLVKDEVDCMVQEEVRIETSSNPVLAAEVHHTHCGNDNGMIQFQPKLGIGPYQFMLNDSLVGNMVEQIPAGSYALTVIDSMNCRDSTLVQIERSTAPQLFYDMVPASCYMENGQILAHGNLGIEPYEFSLGEDYSPDSVFTQLDSGQYALKVVDQDGCVDSVAVNLVYDDRYQKPELENEVSVCEDEPAQLHSGLDEDPVITWTKDNMKLSESTPVISVMEAGQYRVRAFYTDQCILEAETQVLVRGKPKYDLPEADTICLGDTYNLPPSTEVYEFNWQNDLSGTSVAIGESGSYDLVITNEYGCSIDETLNLTVIQPVVLTPSSPIYYSCPGKEITMSVKGADSYLWYRIDDPKDQKTGNEQTIASETDERFQVIGSNVCFSDTLHIPVLVNQNITERTGDTLVIEGSPLPLFAYEAKEIFWKSSYDIECPECAETLVRPEFPGQITVNYLDVNGCAWSDTIQVDITPLAEVLPPLVNVITPNHDGRNDQLTFKGLDVFQSAAIEVFDQRGLKIYQEDRYENNWDGRYDGGVLPEGVYFYLLTLYLDDRVFQFDSDLTIVRD